MDEPIEFESRPLARKYWLQIVLVHRTGRFSNSTLRLGKYRLTVDCPPLVRLRIPTKSNSDSEPNRTLVPSESERQFRLKANSDSGPKRTPIPIHSEQ
jgi:hypothetical protein